MAAIILMSKLLFVVSVTLNEPTGILTLSNAEFSPYVFLYTGLLTVE